MKLRCLLAALPLVAGCGYRPGDVVELKRNPYDGRPSPYSVTVVSPDHWISSLPPGTRAEVVSDGWYEKIRVKVDGRNWDVSRHDVYPVSK